MILDITYLLSIAAHVSNHGTMSSLADKVKRVYCRVLFFFYLNKFMTPKQRYERDLKNNAFQRDEAQAEAIEALDNLYHQFLGVLHAPVQSVSSGRKHFPSTIFHCEMAEECNKDKARYASRPERIISLRGRRARKNVFDGYVFCIIANTAKNASSFSSFHASGS
ncbi:hypothetical protein P4S72_26880 [Vibrio sp. PP-XX7]